MTDPKNKKPKSATARELTAILAHERLVKIEKALWGDLEAIEKWNLPNFPKGAKPPGGLTELVAVLGEKVNAIAADVDEIDERLPLGPTEDEDGKLATRGWVDKSLTRVAAALREEWTRAIKAPDRSSSQLLEADDRRRLGAIENRLDGLNQGVQELAQFLTSAMTKKIRQRIFDLAGRWLASERGEWVIRAVQDYESTLANRLVRRRR